MRTSRRRPLTAAQREALAKFVAGEAARRDNRRDAIRILLSVMGLAVLIGGLVYIT